VALIGSGSAIICWTDSRNGQTDLYAQQESSSGSGWLVDGLPVCRAPGYQFYPVMIGDLHGGAIVAWDDNRAADADIYVQRVNGMGTPLWPVDGAALCTAANNQGEPVIVGDFASGVICAWADDRGIPEDIYVQRADSSGVSQWGTNGLPLCEANGSQLEPVIASDGAGGAIAAWADSRTAAWDIYANHIPADGGVAAVQPSLPRPRLRILDPIPNPTADATMLRLILPASRAVTARVFSADGRVVRTLAEGRELPAGPVALRWDGRDLANKRVSSGIYWLRIDAGGESGSRRVLIVH
jgi:hypothetical protein